MKKGISWQTLPTGFSKEDKFQLAVDAGYDGVEIASSDNDSEVLDTKEIAEGLNIEIPSIISMNNWKFPLSNNDKEIRKKSRDLIIRDLYHASIIGAKTVLCVPGVVDKQTSYEDAYNNSLLEIKYIAEFANKYSVNLGIENVWNKFLLSPIEFIDFIDKVDSPFVKAYFDIGNICLYGFPQHWITALSIKRIAGVHVKGFLDYPNDIGFPKTLISDVPWAETMAALKLIRYDEYLTVEIKNSKLESETIDNIYKYSSELTTIIKEFY